MKMRWRILTWEQRESGDVKGCVTVARTEHYSEHCVLEFQPDEQTDKTFWTQVPLYREPL